MSGQYFQYSSARRDGSRGGYQLWRAVADATKTAWGIFFAQQREVMRAPVMRRILEQIATVARQLLAAPNKQKWREHLDDHLKSSRYDRSGLPVRTRRISTAGGPELSELKRTLDYGPPYEIHLTTLKKLAQMDCEPGSVTKSRDPSLQGLISVVVPLWEKITGRLTWAREENGDMVSPLHPWFQEIMGEEAPKNDQLIKATLLL